MKARAVKTGRAQIDGVRAEAYTIPTEAPESDGTLEWNQTTLVVVHVTAGGEEGIGFTYSTPGVAQIVSDTLAGMLSGRDPMDVSGLWSDCIAQLRNFGHQGVSATAVAAVDVALWDLKARLLQCPLPLLIGRVRDSVPVYGSGGFTSYSDQTLREQFERWGEAGITAFKMKVGREPRRDLDRVRTARSAIGADADLFVDANSAYTVAQAEVHARAFAGECGVTWLEEPLDPEDFEGMRFLRGRMPDGLEIAEGEYGYSTDYFRRLLTEDSADVVMPDATRCAGITGFQKIAALCDAWHKPLSSHCAPALHAIIGSTIDSVRHIEYFHDHARIESMFFEGIAGLRDGRLHVNTTRPGAGWEFKQKDAARFAA